MKLEILEIALHCASDLVEGDRPDVESYIERLGICEPITSRDLRSAASLGNALARFALAAVARLKADDEVSS